MGAERDRWDRPELQDQGVEPVEAEWANTAVFGRYPSGTDPRDALREVMTVFMERADGTNALPWWNQKSWWHAGPPGLSKGDRLLPPSETGKVPLLDSDHHAVYVTNDRAEAVMYAAQHVIGAFDDRGVRVGAMPRIYRVTVSDEPQPDDTQPDSETSWRVPSAEIRRVEHPSRSELAAAVDEIMAFHEAQLAAKLVEAAEAEVEDAGG